MKIAVVNDTGSAQGNAILNGVYGELIQDESGGTRFLIAPEFKRISHLFDLMEGGSVPVSPTDIVTYEVPDILATSVKGNLMHARGKSWESLYKSVGLYNSQSIALSSMLSIESGRTAMNTRNHLISMGLRPYEVAYKYDAQSTYASTELATLQQLMRNMRPTANAVLEISSVTVVPIDVLARAEQVQEVNDNNEEDYDAFRTREWSFNGHHAAGNISGVITVVAMNEDAARQMAAMALGVSVAALEQNTDSNTNAQPTTALAEVPNDANNRSVNSVRDNILSGVLTPKPIAVENLHQGSAVVYINQDRTFEMDRDESEDSDGGFERPRA
jgi:hypothetical protein